MTRRSLPPQVRARGVTAVLGPTNTGKTHLAIERMLGHESGMIGLPLRLLAREVYQRVVEKAGAHNVALVTGEEKIKPDRPRYWISTVEAMPRDLDLAFVAVDEIQLAADLDRGHVFTDRLLNQRGREETLLIGSNTMRPLIETLIPGVHVITRPRLSQLSFAGEKKVSRLPRRTAIVAFSAEEVYAIAELIRRQRGGAAVVLGALSPRTRNAQVELYQSGDVEYLVATDAVGMGLNLDVDHVAFAADRKFDGFRFRKLYPAELAQIAGRAGRHMRDGTFGTAGRCPPFDAETVEALENHAFDPVRIVQWRNPDLDFSSLGRLRDSLSEQPREYGLVRAPMGEDVAALEILARDDDVQAYGRSKVAVERLWQVCQVPDYRKVSPQTHADLVGQLYRFLMKDGSVPADWFSRHLLAMDRTDGDIDTLSNRIAQVRTWSFVANRPDWLKDPEHWQGVARQVEDKLSDALHERLAQRFIDRRTSVLMRRLRENTMLEAEITTTGDVTVEGQHIGHLHGFHFVPDPQADTTEAKTLRSAAGKALAGEIEARADRFAEAPDTMLVLSNDGTIRWMGDPVAKLEPGDKLFEPRLRILSDEQLTGPARDKVDGRLKAWLRAYIVRLLGPLMELESSQELTGLARGIGFQIVEALGVLERAKVLNDVRSLDQDARGALRKAGVRFGAYHLYLPALLKPAPRILAAQLWALQNGGLDQRGIDEIAHLAQSGRTSIPVDKEIAAGLYRAAGFRVCGDRAVRVDILERLADLIRPAIAYRPGATPGEPPAGAADGESFVATVAMTSLVGCAGEDFGTILKSLGYVMDRRPGPAITVPLVQAAATTALAQPSGDAASDAPAAEAPAEAAVAAPVEAGEPNAAALESVEASAFVPETAPEEAETVAASVESAETSVEAPAEPEVIEVWRQHRRHHEGGHARQGRGRPERGDRRPRHGEPRSEDRAPRHERRPERREATGEGGRPQNRPPRGPGRPDERRNGGGRPDKRSEPRREPSFDRREKQPDPNSPFAKLMALKAQLEDSKK
ncbi:helicase-related protein [Microvirga puerhi]|uniref:Helicase n=1 Tax=Microvirga puerhi TaxID=2876078 RepID=A0ABS7VLN4_9HYPH|nr:helicase-related protein [Microvirga puerhi]MBZ6075863.1 helicase [Microvirga puerhi]